jgi:non-specific serine/threonine protein kinase
MGDEVRPGDVVGGYVVEAEIARGGMGIVYRARDEALARPIALKVIAAPHSGDRGFRERFRSECLMAARIEHPAVIPIFRTGQDRGRLYLAMRFVEGEDLAAVLRRGTLDPDRAVAIVGQVAGALDAAHAAGLVHRDVKPANVLLEGDSAFLTDFGVAVDPGGDIRLTSTGQWVGTLAYAAPEQIRGGAVDARTDVYALGGLLHHCLTGELPFPVEHELDAISAHLVDPPPRPSAVDPRLARAYDDVVGRAMSKDPADRFPSAGALAEAALAVARGIAPPPVRAAGKPIAWISRPGLPDQPTPLVGRHRELDALIALVRERRLVTLTGPGGAGKTRLALQVAAELEGDVAFVPLASVTDPELVGDAIARALGEPELAERRILVVLDNAEQVVAGAAERVAELLAAAPGLRVLATSRIRLDLREEQEFPVDPLDTADAVVLFTQAARRARPGFDPDHHVDALVGRLDGLPLALELAASRVRVLTPAQIGARLGQDLDLLTTSARDVPARQRTLRATIEWSHDLLGEAERTAFARLAAFAGSFDADAAEAVCEAGLASLQALVDHSLLRETGDGRFFMLETIRAFAAERLAADPALSSLTRRRHLEHFAALVSGGAPAGEAMEAWITRARRELPNLRLALETAAETDPETLARLVADLHMAWHMLGSWDEYAAWVQRARERPPADPALELELIDTAAVVAHMTGDHAEAALHYGAIAQRAGELGDRHGELVALARQGAQHLLLGEVETAEAVLHRALEGADAAGDLAARARATSNLAASALVRRDFAAAMRLADETAVAYRELGEEDVLAQALTNAGLAAVRAGEPERAEAYFAEALEIFARFGWREGIGYVLVGTAAAIAREGDARCAGLLVGKAHALCEEVGFAFEPFEQDMADEALATARERLGPEAADRAFADGRELSDEEAGAVVARLHSPATVIRRA